MPLLEDVADCCSACASLPATLLFLLALTPGEFADAAVDGEGCAEGRLLPGGVGGAASFLAPNSEYDRASCREPTGLRPAMAAANWPRPPSHDLVGVHAAALLPLRAPAAAPAAWGPAGSPAGNPEDSPPGSPPGNPTEMAGGRAAVVARAVVCNAACGCVHRGTRTGAKRQPDSVTQTARPKSSGDDTTARAPVVLTLLLMLALLLLIVLMALLAVQRCSVLAATAGTTAVARHAAPAAGACTQTT